MGSTTRAAVLAAMLTLSLVAMVPISAGQQDIVAIDADHELDRDGAISEYERDGVVARDFTRLDMTVTIADKRQDAGVEGWHTNINHKFVCVDYREDIGRTVRISLHEDYFQPRVNADLDSISTQTTANLEPTGDGEYTAMTMTFDGRERACFKLSREAGIYFSVKGSAYDVVNNSTDWEIPRLAGSSEQWQYVEGADYTNNTAAINTSGESLTLQFDADPDPATETWLSVPKCEDPSEQRVCRYEKATDPETVHLLTTEDEPPTARYKTGHDPWANARAWAADLREVPGRMSDAISGLFGGGGAGGD